MSLVYEKRGEVEVPLSPYKATLSNYYLEQKKMKDCCRSVNYLCQDTNPGDAELRQDIERRLLVGPLRAALAWLLEWLPVVAVAGMAVFWLWLLIIVFFAWPESGLGWAVRGH